jgi:hypothetical protein
MPTCPVLKQDYLCHRVYSHLITGGITIIPVLFVKVIRACGVHGLCGVWCTRRLFRDALVMMMMMIPIYWFVGKKK